MSVTVPQEVIADIYQRLQTLENINPATNEHATANYLTVSPTGQVGADFTGVITALGLTIPADPGSPPAGAAHRIQWTRQADGAVLATTGVADNNGVEAFKNDSLNVGGPEPSSQWITLAGASDGSYAGWSATDNSGAPSISVVTHAISGSGGQGPGSYGVQLLDGFGRSGFMQFQTGGLNPAVCVAAAGQATITFGAGSSASVTVIPPIQAGASSNLIFVSPVSTSGFISNWMLFGVYAGPSGINPSFTVTAVDYAGAPGAGTTVTFNWLALALSN